MEMKSKHPQTTDFIQCSLCFVSQKNKYPLFGRNGLCSVNHVLRATIAPAPLSPLSATSIEKFGHPGETCKCTCDTKVLHYDVISGVLKTLNTVVRCRLDKGRWVCSESKFYHKT